MNPDIYTIVSELPGDLPADQIPTPSLDGTKWLLRGQHDGLQLTTEEAKRWVADNATDADSVSGNGVTHCKAQITSF